MSHFDRPYYDDGYNDWVYGEAFTGDASSVMGPPPRPGTFDAEMARSLTPPGRRSWYMSDSDYDPGMNGHWHDTLLNDGLLSSLAAERAIALQDRQIDYDEFFGQNPDRFNYGGRLHGSYDDDFREQGSLLMEGLPGGMRPTAREEMPGLRHGGDLDFPQRVEEVERGWSGWNDSMPAGAVGYVGRYEPRGWGHQGPRMYPGEIVDDDFIRNREADAGWDPPDFDEWDYGDGDRLHFGGANAWRY
ncbi:hypothetical protein LTR86_010028 [Recurvomyces mirabilis]|nr:hypothetical protein LTR86_010028 [Recurvomyces mirabilis]